MARAMLAVSLALPFALVGGSPASAAVGTAITACRTTISAPGFYYLATNFACISGDDGIQITASNVQLSLDGHTITGADGGAIGIYVKKASSVVIQGPGTITDFSQGIVFDGVQQSRVSGITVTSNIEGFLVRNFLAVPSQGNSFMGNTASSNFDNGFFIGGSGHNVLTDNTAVGNDTIGIYIATGAVNTVRGSTANLNAVYGILVDAGATGSVIQANTAKTNGIDDLVDNNPNCGTDHWQGNTFDPGKASPAPCIH